MTTPAQVKSACSYCGVGCGMLLQVETDETGRRRVAKVAGDKQHPANRGRLCTKGATSAAMLAAPGVSTTAARLPSAHLRHTPAPLHNAPAALLIKPPIA